MAKPIINPTDVCPWLRAVKIPMAMPTIANLKAQRSVRLLFGGLSGVVGFIVVGLVV